MNKVIDKGFRSCRFVSTIVKHPVLEHASLTAGTGPSNSCTLSDCYYDNAC